MKIKHYAKQYDENYWKIIDKSSEKQLYEVSYQTDEYAEK